MSDPGYCADWGTLTLPGAFSLEMPKTASYSFIKDGRTLVIRLATDPATEILAGCFPFSPEDIARIDEGYSNASAIEAAVRRFCEIAVSKATETPCESRIERLPRPAPSVVACQGVVCVGQVDRWLVRGYAMRGSHDFHLLHWNGEERDISEIVVRIFDTIRLDPNAPRPTGANPTIDGEATESIERTIRMVADTIAEDGIAGLYPVLFRETAQEVTVSVLDPRPAYDLVERAVAGWCSAALKDTPQIRCIRVAFAVSDSEVEVYFCNATCSLGGILRVSDRQVLWTGPQPVLPIYDPWRRPGPP